MSTPPSPFQPPNPNQPQGQPYQSQPQQYPTQGQQYPSQGQQYPVQPQGQPYQSQGQPYQSQGQPYPSQGQPYSSQGGPQTYGTGAVPAMYVTPGVVAAGSVAGQVADYVEIAGRGAVKLASTGDRLLARILDWVILAVVSGILIGIPVMIATAGAANGSDSAAGFGIGGFILSVFLIATINLAYEIVMIAFWGATLGKMIMKVKVVKATDGNAPGLLSSFLRYLIPGICAYIPFIGGLGTLLCYISFTFDGSGRRQGWHDEVASTLVVKNVRV